jgi:hypothetical protein
MIRLREVHSEAVSGHLPIYLDLGVYGHGPWLRSLHMSGIVPHIGHLSRDRKTWYTMTGYMEEARTWIL